MCTLSETHQLFGFIIAQIVLGLISVYMSKNKNVKSNSLAEFIFDKISSAIKPKQKP